ncbi:hypothetical protein ACHAWC_006588 [Mediolabrus comicus]
MSSNNGGILRSAAKQKKKTVSFSARDNDYVNHHHNPTSSIAGHNDEYDSDEVEDAILASGDGLSSMMERHHTKSDNNIMDDDNNDPAVHNSLEIEEAKRKRGRVRRNEDFGGNGDGTSAGDFDNDDNHNDDNDNTLSLITDHGANPDTYESNAGGNASCPVEPFNMNAEQESGMGYFDGDTYVFRHNSNKPVDGEEDAWLDGFKGDNDENDDENDEEEGKSGNVGGLDSTAVWKPSNSYTKTNNNTKQKEKFKFINENAKPEDIGQRVITLLQSNDETVMRALSRLGSQLREMQAKEQKLKKSKLRKRKSKAKQETAVDNTDADEEMKNLSLQMEQTRKVVEELTELADALLFGGEADSYELTKADWVHRFKLIEATTDSDLMRKRPVDDDNITADAKPEAKKQRRGYFDVTTTDDDANEDIMWEYKGNEDGSIHGPYTSKQMLEWTSCGYFVGESAVDIRRVGSLSSEVASNKKKGDETTNPPPKTDVDDLMADLEFDEEDNHDDDEGGGGSENTTTAKTAESSWMRSDRVDFSLYL